MTHESDAIAVVLAFLEMGRNDHWAWETCVEDSASALGISPADHEIEAVMQVSRVVNLRYPWKNAALWRAIDTGTESRKIVNLTNATFESVAAGPTPDYSQRYLENLAAEINIAEGPYEKYALRLLKCPFRWFPGDTFRVPGVYALWRYENYGSLVYIGQSSNIEKDRLKTYLPGGSYPWWGRDKICVTYVEMPGSSSSEREDVERYLIQTLRPTGN